MDIGIFKKLKVKPGMSARVFRAPMEYPSNPELACPAEDSVDFVHLFVDSQTAFAESFENAAQAAKADALFWLSYPKSSGKKRYDINRDSLWDLVLPRGWHPVAQVSLDDDWSAIRLRPNETGKEYVRPNNMKAPG